MVDIRVTSIDEILEHMNMIGQKFMPSLQKAFEASLRDNIERPSKNRVPVSDPNRYAPKDNKGRRRWTKNYPPGSSGTLLRSFKLGMEPQTGGITAVVQYDAQRNGKGYSRYVHDMQDPTASGKPVKWSKASSGNQYLGMYVEQNKQKIASDTSAYLWQLLGLS